MLNWEQWMPENYAWAVYIIRVVLSVLLGFAIGVERKIRFKEAGMRTHSLVAAGACLFMLISKYGFADIEKYDGARLAAQVVSGIGFIGAGMIMYRKQAIHGLTTAAGVWFTAGVGMAAGAGMYILAVVATAIIITVQCILHLNIPAFRAKRYMQLNITFINNNNESEKIREIFGIDKYLHLDAKKQDNDIIYKISVRTSQVFDDVFIANVLRENPYILSIDRIDEES